MKTLTCITRAAAAFAALLAGLAATAQDIKVDPALQDYQKVDGIGGTLNSIGSDTLNNLMTYWAEAFKQIYPNVTVQVEGKGSSTAPTALTEGTAQLGPMSRKMKSSEEDAFEAKFGFKPTAVGVALDSLAVYVNKDNPLPSLTFPQLDAIYSKTRSGGHADIVTWGQLGLAAPWDNQPISLYGRNSASGTYAYFKEHALFKGDYKDSVKEQPGSSSVVMGISEDKNGIGYSGIGYRTSGVRVVPLAEKDGGQPFEPTYENVIGGKYPLSRMLYIYAANNPNEPMTPLTREFLKFVLSKQGQEIVVKDGYLPLPAKVVDKQRALLD